MSQGIHKWKVKLTGTSQTFVKEIGITSNLKDILRINKSEEVLEVIRRFGAIRREVGTCFYYDGNEGDIVSNSLVSIVIPPSPPSPSLRIPVVVLGRVPCSLLLTPVFFAWFYTLST